MYEMAAMYEKASSTGECTKNATGWNPGDSALSQCDAVAEELNLPQMMCETLRRVRAGSFPG